MMKVGMASSSSSVWRAAGRSHPLSFTSRRRASPPARSSRDGRPPVLRRDLRPPDGRHRARRAGGDARRRCSRRRPGARSSSAPAPGSTCPTTRPRSESLTITEPDPHMATRACGRSSPPSRRRSEIEVVEAGAERLPFEDASFDTVVSTLVLCTVDDPERGGRGGEAGAARPGAAALLEHVRDPDEGRLARWQDRLERPWGWFAGGCHPNRDTAATLRAAGFDGRVSSPTGCRRRRRCGPGPRHATRSADARWSGRGAVLLALAPAARKRRSWRASSTEPARRHPRPAASCATVARSKGQCPAAGPLRRRLEARIPSSGCCRRLRGRGLRLATSPSSQRACRRSSSCPTARGSACTPTGGTMAPRRARLGDLPSEGPAPRDRASLPDPIRSPLARHRRGLDGRPGNPPLRGDAARLLRVRRRLLVGLPGHAIRRGLRRPRHPPGERRPERRLPDHLRSRRAPTPKATARRRWRPTTDTPACT